MKLRYILTALAAALTLATACEKEADSYLDDIRVSSSYVTFPAEGSTKTITVTATADWSFPNEIPGWLSITPTSGSAGETKVTFTAGKATSTNEGVLKISCGSHTQYINVLQQTEKQELPVSSCSTVLSGTDGVTYRVKGTCTAISNTTYGNFYLNDGTGEVYIYGTVDASGSYNWSSFNIEVGDIVTVEGPRTNYNGTIELVDAAFIGVTKSLVWVDPKEFTAEKEGGIVDIKVTYKGKGLDIVPQVDWLSLSGITVKSDTTYVSIKVAPNADDRRSGTVKISSSITGQTSDQFVTVTQASGLAAYPLPFEESFGKDLGSFEINNINVPDGTTVWAWASSKYGVKGAAPSKIDTESDLVSPNIDLSKVSSAVLSFEHVQRYFGIADDELTLWVTTDNGTTWKQVLIPNNATGKDWNFVKSGQISLKPFVGNIIKFAFKYKSTTAANATWEIKNLTVVEGEPVYTCIAELNDGAAVETGFSAELKDAVVSYVNGNNAFIEDTTGGIQIYMKSHGLKAGQVLNGTVSGKFKLYSGYAEMTSIDVSKATVTEGTAPLTTLTLDTLLKSYIRYQNRFVKLEDVTMTPALTTSNRNSVLTQGTSTIAVYSQIKNSIEIPADTKGDLVCIPIRYNATLQLGVWESAHFTAK